MLLETSRLYLREIETGDFAAICEILQDIDVMYAWEHAFSDAEVVQWIAENRMRYTRDGYSYWTVIEKASGTLAGVTGLLAEQAEEERCIGVGYIYNKRHWGRGYAFEAASACVAYGFDVLGLDEITAQIRPENAPSRRLAEKLGMRVRKQFVRQYRGKAMPHLLYGRGKAE